MGVIQYFCTYIGAKIKFKEKNQMTPSPKSKLIALVLCAFGVFGAHRFYVRKIGTGILYLLTLGLFGIGVWVDLVRILMNKFTDDKGQVVSLWRLDEIKDRLNDGKSKAN